MENIFLFFAVALVMTTCWASPLQTFASSELRTRSEVSVMKILREQNVSARMEKSALVDALQQALGSTLTGEEMANREDKSYCHCQKNACACCVDLKIKKGFIHFEGKACVNAQFLPSELAIQAEVTFNDKVLWKKKVSGKNPPEICLPFPKMKKASLCIKFHDLSYQSHQVSGCIGLSVKIAGGQVYKVELGCFKIPPSEDALEVTGTPGIPATSEIFPLEAENHQHDILKAILEQPEMIEAFQKALRGLSLTDEELTDQGNNSMCQCHGTACGCCVKINVKKVVHFSGEACVNVRYLPTHIGVEADVTWNGKVLFKKEISVKNPPPICMPVPEFPAVALCVQFHDLSFHDHKASGCIDVSVKAVHITVFKVKLGCFHIPPNEENVALLEDQSQIALDQHSPVQHAWMSTAEAEDQDQIAKKLFETFVQTDVDLEKTSLCVCMDGTCTCCLHFASSTDDAVCAQFQSVSESMDVTLLVNDQTIINEQVAVRNPTRTCVSTGGGQKLANLCLSLTNLDVQSLSFSGCAELEADLVGMTIKKRTIGCFDSPPEQLTPETKMIVY